MAGAGPIGSRTPGPADAYRPLPRRPTLITGNVVQQLPPPRPATTSALRPPVGSSAPPRPRTVHAAVVLWWAAALAVAVGLGAALLDLAALEARLGATATGQDPAELVADGVRATVAVVLGSVALLTALALVWVRQVGRRRGRARWGLLLTALPLLLALDVAQSVVAGDADLDRFALLAAGALAVAGLVPLLTRSARAWFGGEAPGRGGTPG